LCALLGYARDELIEQPVQKVIHPEELQQEFELAEAILSGSAEPIQRESRLIRKTGEVVRANVTATTVRDPSGAPRFGLGMVEDITARKRAEGAQRRNDATSRALLLAIPDLHFRVDRKGTLLDFYPAENLRTYVPPSEFLGKTIGDVLPPNVADLCLGGVQRALDTGQTQVFEYDLSVGERLGHFECRLAVCAENEVVSVVRDITERNRAENERARLASIVRSSRDGIVAGDLDGRINYWNPGAERLYGYSADEVLGKHVSMLIPPECMREAMAVHARILRGEFVGNYETQRLGKGGSRVNVSLTISPVRNRDGCIIGTSAIARDITIRKRTETLLRAISEGTSATIGDQYFRSLVQHLATSLGVDFAFICEALDEQWTKVRDICIWTGQGYGKSGERDTIGTPCRHVRIRQLVYHKLGVHKIYPEDRWIAQNGIEGYLAVPVFDSSGRAVGHTGVAHRGPITDVTPIVPILKIFATRVGAELERRGHEVELARAHGELESRVTERTRELAEANERLQAEVAERKKAVKALRRREKALAASHEALRGLASRLITVQEEERSRLARELHDDLTQHLAALAIEIGDVGQHIAAGGEAQRRLRDLQEELGKMSSDVHAMSRRLHPWILECLGLADAIESECTSLAETAGIEILFSHDGAAATLPEDAALCLYRITQESLRNIVKHSGAKKAVVDLSVGDTDVVLTVRDNGAGFDSEMRSGAPGLGLTAMAERARLCGGSLTINSAPGEGTLVTARLPLQPDEG